jgi:hypothetical protein
MPSFEPPAGGPEPGHARHDSDDSLRENALISQLAELVAADPSRAGTDERALKSLFAKLGVGVDDSAPLDAKIRHYIHAMETRNKNRAESMATLVGGWRRPELPRDDVREAELRKW